MIKYSANWHRNEKFGNAIKSGDTLNVKLENAVVCTGQIKKKVWYGWKLMQIAQGVNFIKFNLKKKKHGKTVGYDPGHYQLTWDGSGLGSGIYFIDFQARDTHQFRKISLVK